MNPIEIFRHNIHFFPESERVIMRPFIPNHPPSIAAMLDRVMAMSIDQVIKELDSLRQEFNYRHFNVEAVLHAHYEKLRPNLFTAKPLSKPRQLLIGALCSGEYALESAAIFNPSIVPHPDQNNLPEGDIRFVMSLRATGEGHISSIEFRTGIIKADGHISTDPTSRFVTAPEKVPNPNYKKSKFVAKLIELGITHNLALSLMAPLEENFNLNGLKKNITNVQKTFPVTHALSHALNSIQWLADSNYELLFSEKLAMSERIIFPTSPTESNGIEDARFVRFTDIDGSVLYYATYTAYNGQVVIPQLIETPDFLHFKILTLNGNAVQNKGMALFPRRINNKYAMLSRHDGENLFIMFSDDPHTWNNPQLLLRPAELWECVKIGNCGSPIETKAGWLVITHGVGPMRKYCIGAILLDLEDPTRVLGRLQSPLLMPQANEREGYVPNVVYSCGSMIHGNTLILPYAMSDKATKIASTDLDKLIAAILEVPLVVERRRLDED